MVSQAKPAERGTDMEDNKIAEAVGRMQDFLSRDRELGATEYESYLDLMAVLGMLSLRYRRQRGQTA